LHGWVVACAVLLVALPVGAQDFDGVEIETTPLRRGLHMMQGAGGNLLVSTGADGVLVIDDQYAPLAGRIRAAIEAIGPGPIRWVVNTHWHGDHTGGNEEMAEHGAVIVAHDNVRRRMSTEQFMAAFQRKVPPSPARALPTVTFGQSLTFHFNDDEVRVVHVPAAHTDGDALIHFREADVLHTGDLFFNGTYPFFDTSSGGAFRGMIAATGRLLELAGDDTLIVPGHGPLATRSDLVAYREMLIDVEREISGQIAAGRARAEIVASRPTRAHDARWGQGFLKPESFAALVYESLIRAPER
jgi:glyoxylase-like metal-dependent hydrolase (beta-lactamase superfamily II)